VQAEAGCDIIAPSDMMAAGRRDPPKGSTPPDSSTYRSCRMRRNMRRRSTARSADAIGSAKTLTATSALSDGQRQLQRGLAQVELDIAEGADMVMVKRGCPTRYRAAGSKTPSRMPTFVYQVSGEYANDIGPARRNGWIDGRAGDDGKPFGLKRAGATASSPTSQPRRAEKLSGGVALPQLVVPAKTQGPIATDVYVGEAGSTSLSTANIGWLWVPGSRFAWPGRRGYCHLRRNICGFVMRRGLARHSGGSISAGNTVGRTDMSYSGSGDTGAPGATTAGPPHAFDLDAARIVRGVLTRRVSRS